MCPKIKTVIVYTMSIILGLSVYGCKDWEHDVEKQGIHFKKIHQSAGGTYTGFMTENRTIQGFPCEKGWIHFDEDWHLLSFQLSNDFMYNSTLLPAHTWVHFPFRDSFSGYVCSFPRDLEVQGYLCSGTGGYKGTHTGFYKNGSLRSFYPPDDVTVQGVPCASSLLVNVQLYQNGSIKRCKLAREYRSRGKTFKKGTTVNFDKRGNTNR